MGKKKISIDLDEKLIENIVKEQGKRMKDTGKTVHLTDIITETLEEKFNNKK